jgi:ergothioneine biosynthesis protein EgtB
MPVSWYLLYPTRVLEASVLMPYADDYQAFQPGLEALFSQLQTKTSGHFYTAPAAVSLARPTVEVIFRYRSHVDRHICALMEKADDDSLQRFIGPLRLALQHEQRYQEQMLSDIKFHFAANPLQPVYHDHLPALPAGEAPAQHWFDYFGGLDEIGFEGAGFAFDNERPRHQVYIYEFRLASRLVTNGEYREFMSDGGYERADLWLHEGWELCRNLGWQAPLYWQLKDHQWQQMTLGGLCPVAAAEPVCHVSYFEADAYARWAGKRLPSEAEWEVSAEALPVQGNLRDSGFLQPVTAGQTRAPQQLFGDVWEWTQSHHDPYPNYQTYWERLEAYENFPARQMVLRGGSCLSAPDHIRASYRYACSPVSRLPVTGFRLAESW